MRISQPASFTRADMVSSRRNSPASQQFRQTLEKQSTRGEIIGGGQNTNTPAAKIPSSYSPIQLLFGAGSSTPAAATPSAPPASAATAPADEDPPTTDPVAALRTALKKVGIEPGSINFTYAEELIGYPGGSYMNKQITATFQNGKSEHFDANLTLKNPRVAAGEIARLLGTPV
jgi:hypothetical protein